MGAFDADGIIGPVFEGRARRRAAKQRAAVVAGLDFGVDELVASTADPLEAAAFNDQLTSFRDMAMASDPALQQQGLAGLQSLGTAVREALKERRTQRVGFVSEALRDQRERFTESAKRQREVQSMAEQMNSLLEQPDFDPNTPLNRGVLMGLLNSSPRQLLSDPEDLADALGAVGGSGLFGGVVGLLSGAMAAEDFVFTKEDWRKLGEAAYVYNSKPFLAESEAIAGSVQQLEQVAGSLQMFPPGYSPMSFVMEQAGEFANPFGPRGSYPEVQSADAPSVLESAGSRLRSALNNAVAPPVESGPPAPQQFDEQGAFLIDRVIAPHRERGARIMVQPGTGDAWAEYPDGRQEKIEMTGLEKWLLKRKVGNAQPGR